MLSSSNCVYCERNNYEWSKLLSTRKRFLQCATWSNTALPFNTGLFNTQASSVITGPVPAQVLADCDNFYTSTRQDAWEKQGAFKYKKDLICFKRYFLYWHMQKGETRHYSWRNCYVPHIKFFCKEDYLSRTRRNKLCVCYELFYMYMWPSSETIMTDYLITWDYTCFSIVNIHVT